MELHILQIVIPLHIYILIRELELMNKMLLWIKRNYYQIVFFVSLLCCVLSTFLTNKYICWFLCCCFAQQLLVFVSVLYRIVVKKQIINNILNLAEVCTVIFITMYCFFVVYCDYPYNHKLLYAIAAIFSFCIVGSNIIRNTGDGSLIDKNE